MPADVFQGAKDTLTTWILLLFFCLVLGFVLILFGVGNHHD